MNIRHTFIVKDFDYFRLLHETYSGRFFLHSPGLIEIDKNRAMVMINEAYEEDAQKQNLPLVPQS